MLTSLHGKTAIVTGASRGIGLATAQALAREGVRLVLLSRTPPPAGTPGQYLPCDLDRLDQIPAVAAEALKHLGALDCLINNAGLFLESPLHQIPVADWERIQRVNVTAPFLLTREVLPSMIARQQGRIVNIASSASFQGYLQQGAYVTSKHALLGFARTLALEVKPHGIRVHNICPGGVDTAFIKGTQLGARLQGQTMITPADIAELVVFVLRQPDNIDLPEIILRRFNP